MINKLIAPPSVPSGFGNQNISPKSKEVNETNRTPPLTVAIPTLTQYTKLARLCESLSAKNFSGEQSEPPRIFILDNGGQLLNSSEGRELTEKPNIAIATPSYNLGVAGSWNFFAREIGRCLISNDDVVFGTDAIREFEEAARLHLDAIIIENDDRSFGFSTFLLNKPNKWLAMGGFDELFNPSYFEDDDARRRLDLARAPAVKIKLKNWAHESSSTMRNGDSIHQRMFWCLFNRNEQYYVQKWGGKPGSEIYRQPFGGKKS